MRTSSPCTSRGRSCRCTTRAARSAWGWATPSPRRAPITWWRSTIRGSPSETSIVFQGGKPLGITEPLPPRELGPQEGGALRRGRELERCGKVIGLLLLRAGAALVHPGRGGGRGGARGHRVGRQRGGAVADRRARRESGARRSTPARASRGKDDVLPDRLFEPLENGALRGDRHLPRRVRRDDDRAVPDQGLGHGRLPCRPASGWKRWASVGRRI